MYQRTSFSLYRTALTAPDARGPVISSLLARLPVAMIGFSVLLYVQRATGSFETAGLVAAAMLIGVSAGSVVQGRIIDKVGPTRPILLVTVLFSAAITGLALAIEAGAATPALMLLGTASGLTEPMVSSASRSLWSRLVPEGAVREAAYAYEAISMEVFFILGPAFAGLMITAPWPGTGVLLGAACMVTGSVSFALSAPVRAWRRVEHGPARPLLGALVSPGMRTLVIAALGFGIVIGFVEVAVPAVATAAGHAGMSGLLLSVWSFSSVAFGLAYGLRPWPRAMHLRLPALLAGFGVLVGLLALPVSLAPESMLVLAGAMVLAGALITPQATTHSSAIELLAPRGTATEAFGWVITSVTLGLAMGQSASGFVVERLGPQASFVAAAVVGCALAAAVLARRSTVLRPAREPAEPPAPSEPAPAVPSELALGAQVVQLSAHAELGGRPERAVDVGVHQLDDLARTGVRP